MKIRATKKSDFNQVVLLLEKVGLYGKHLTRIKFNGLVHRNHGFIFVAENNKKIVGTIFACHDGGYYGYIYKLAVAPRFQRQKIGTTLVDTVLEKFKRKDIDWIFMHVKKHNIPSIKIFKNLGFGIRRTHYLMDNQIK